MNERAGLRSILRSAGAVLIATLLWLPALHLCFRRPLSRYRAPDRLAPVTAQLAAAHLHIWTDPALRERELAGMRERNPEWDFMSRTYFVLALANMALREPAFAARACEISDLIIADTVAYEQEKGFAHYLLNYGQAGGWVVRPPRSLFVDGEITLMMAARRFIAEKEDYRPRMAERVDRMVTQMRASPVLCGESYPDECWLFCNTLALAAIRMTDALDGGDHGAFLAEWVRTARARLTEPRTGLLISTFRVNGAPAECGAGPEGSSIWMAAHLLQIVDAEFASDQYRRAHRELARSFLGFGYSREWPRGLEGLPDVDSGPVIPWFEASASASGLAILAAAAFDDTAYLRRLLTSLEAAGFPVKENGRLRYAASNPVGDAVLLYALTQGPLWTEVRRRGGTPP